MYCIVGVEQENLFVVQFDFGVCCQVLQQVGVVGVVVVQVIVGEVDQGVYCFGLGGLFV